MSGDRFTWKPEDVQVTPPQPDPPDEDDDDDWLREVAELEHGP